MASSTKVSSRGSWEGASRSQSPSGSWTQRSPAGGSRLGCHGQRYLKSIGVHSAARLTYVLAEPYERFEADLGIDDMAAGGGSVRFRVFVDGQQRHTSDVIRGGQTPTFVSVEIRGAKRLDLLVDYADRADQLDHADWLDARVIKSR